MEESFEDEMEEARGLQDETHQLNKELNASEEKARGLAEEVEQQKKSSKGSRNRKRRIQSKLIWRC